MYVLPNRPHRVPGWFLVAFVVLAVAVAAVLITMGLSGNNNPTYQARGLAGAQGPVTTTKQGPPCSEAGINLTHQVGSSATFEAVVCDPNFAAVEFYGAGAQQTAFFRAQGGAWQLLDHDDTSRAAALGQQLGVPLSLVAELQAKAALLPGGGPG